MAASDDLEWALRDIEARAPAYKTLQDYYDGRHRLSYVSQRWRTAFAALFLNFADNLCAPVADAVADRLQPQAGDEGGPFTGELGEPAEALWVANAMPRRFGHLVLRTLYLGDAFLVVWPGIDNRPRFYIQRPWTMAVRYDEDDPLAIALAVKVWQQRDKRWRATLYYPDRNERFITPTKREDRPTTPGYFRPLAEGDVEGDTFGPVVTNQWDTVPVFHFANNPQDDGEYGRSELEPVLPLQDALNQTIRNMLVGGEAAALPQRWATGVEVPRDPTTGEELRSPWESGVWKLWTTANENANLGQFPAADFAQLVAVQESFRTEVGRVSGTPPWWFHQGGEVPSGLALRVAEGRLVSKAEDRQVGLGATGADACRLAVRMDGGKAEGELGFAWAPAATRDELYEAQVVAARHEIHQSWDQAMRELGFSDDQIEQLRGQREAGTAQLGQALGAVFDAGGRQVPLDMARSTGADDDPAMMATT